MSFVTNILKQYFIFLLLLICWPSLSNAALLATESFDYTVGGNLAANNLNGPSGFSSAWDDQAGTAPRLITSGSLVMPGVVNFATAGNKATITSGVGEFFEVTSRSLNTSLAANVAGTRYISFLYNSFNNLNIANPANYPLVGLGDASSGGVAGVLFSAAGGTFNINMRTVLGGNLANTAFGSSSANTTYFIVGKYTTDGTGTASAFMNAYSLGDLFIPASEGAWAGQILNQAAGASIINSIRTFQGENTTLNFDEFRVGDTYESVVQIIPEPSTYALLGLGLLALTVLRHRKHSA